MWRMTWRATSARPCKQVTRDVRRGTTTFLDENFGEWMVNRATSNECVNMTDKLISDAAEAVKKQGVSFRSAAGSKGKMTLNIMALQAPRQVRSSVGGKLRMAEEGAAAAAAAAVQEYRGPEVEPIPRAALEQVVREAGGVIEN